MTALFEQALAKLDSRNAIVGVIGLGYVGLPLLAAAAAAGFTGIGFDVDPAKPRQILAGQSYIDAVASDQLKALVEQKKISATTDMAKLSGCDVIVICVPTPLTIQREPDMQYVGITGKVIALHLRKGQLVILESTTYPGTTRDFLIPILEKTGLKCGSDFFAGFSPEREDPGNKNFGTVTIPKVVSGEGADASRLVIAFYGAFIKEVVPVSSTATAEAVKITENIFRAVNIALVNELKTVYDAMGIDIWEVVDAAKTKPFGYMPFYPGPGLGGHCIPIDPFYLTWKAREYDITTRFIELAGEVNRAMPAYVVKRTAEAIDQRHGKSLGKSKILVLGLAYKKNVSDIRESPTFKIMELLEKRGALVSYHDPHVPVIPHTREHDAYSGRKSVALDAASLTAHDAVLIVTDHDETDYALVAQHAALVVDTRNAMQVRGLGGHVVKA
jgi:UDP-N-acetyl-D-glucosamine dehydrogenase